MFTDEEARKAIVAKEAEGLRMKLALMTHKAACEDVDVYGLPYRVLYDHYTGSEKTDGLLLPAPPKREGGHSFESLLVPTDQVSEDGQTVYTLKPTTEDMERERAWIRKEMVPEKLAVFLSRYADELETWTVFDFFGSTEHTEAEAEERREQYKKILDDVHGGEK